MQKTGRSVDFTRGNITKELIRFAIPLFVGSVFSLLYSMVDTAVLGRFVNVDALAAVGATATTLMLIMHLTNGLTNAIAIQTSQAYGAGKEDQLRRILGNSVTAMSACSLFLMICMPLIAPGLLRLLRTPDEIISNSILYVRITCGLYFGQLFYNTSTSILRAVGDSRTPLYFLIFSSVLNVLLDLLFVLGFGWSVAGVAWATVISQVTSAVLCMGYMFRRYPVLRFSLKDMRPDRDVLRSYLRIALPMTFQGGMLAVGDLLVTSVINSFGPDTIAAYTIGQKCLQLVQITYGQLTFSMSVFTGQNYGAKQYERIRTGVRKALILICSLVAVSMAVMLLFGDQLMLIYLDPETAGEAVRDLVREYIGVTTFFMPALALILTFLSILRGLGHIPPTVISSFLELACKIAFSLLLSRWFGTRGLWFALPLGWVIGMVPLVYHYYFTPWKKELIPE